jgi:hypothetical protein
VELRGPTGDLQIIAQGDDEHQHRLHRQEMNGCQGSLAIFLVFVRDEEHHIAVVSAYLTPQTLER